VPFEEGFQRSKAGLPVPEHMANAIYLEWFSDANGRVVIESADYKVEISPPTWRLSAKEEQQRRREAAEGFSGFMGRLNAALEAARHDPPPDKEWDEFDHEKLLRESDARTDKYAELLDKYEDHPNCDAIIDKEMGWNLPAKQSRALRIQRRKRSPWKCGTIYPTRNRIRRPRESIGCVKTMAASPIHSRCGL